MLQLEFRYATRDPFAYRKVLGDAASIWALWYELKTHCAKHEDNRTAGLVITIRNLNGETLDLSKGTGINDFYSFDTPLSYG